MNTTKPFAWLVCLVSLACSWRLAGEEVAVVNDNRINVRGQPSLAGEVITQLQKGEKVVVLEEISVSKPKTNEPPRWARIQMPPNTPVWVFASFVDLTNKSVRVPRLNLRAGPGENYSVVGRLQKGATVTEIRRVENWLEIETPPGAYAFVAANLLSKPGPADMMAQKEAAQAPVPATAPPPAAAPTLIPAPPLPAETAKPERSPIVTAQSPPPDVAAAPTQTAVVQPAEPSKAAPEKAAEQPKPQMFTPPPLALSESSTTVVVSKPKEEGQISRVVRREGIVRSTVSIQAPAYYELLSPGNHKTINFLHADSLGLNLKDYRGRTIIVTGEESIDPRWPRIPLIEVKTLELIP